MYISLQIFKLYVVYVSALMHLKKSQNQPNDTNFGFNDKSANFTI